MTSLTKSFSLVLPVAALLAALTLAASADDGKSQPAEGKRRGPPPAAFTACEKLRLGDTCRFEGRDRQVEGTCAQPPRGDGLVCRPADGPRSRGGDKKVGQ